MPVYDKEGNEITDIATVLTPEQIDEIVRSNPKHQIALKEAIERRQTIKELRNQLGSTLEHAAAEPSEEKPAVKTEQVQVNPDEIVGAVLTKLSDREKAAADKEALITEVLQANKLNPSNKSFRVIVSAGSDKDGMNGLAAALAQSGMRFDETPGGNGQGDINSEGLIANVNKRLFKAQP